MWKNRKLYNQWVRQYAGDVRRYFGTWGLSRTEVDDLTQEAFLQVWKSMHTFRQETSPKVWLLTICKRLAWKSVKARNPQQVRDIEELYDYLPDPTDNQALLEQRSRLKTIVANLPKLSPNHQEVLLLHYMQELTEPEIAEFLEIPKGTVHSRLRFARQKLRILCQAD